MPIDNDDCDPFRLDPYLASLRDVLSGLPEQHRIAFALWCCEQLRPAFDALALFLGSGDDRIVRDIQSRLWRHVAGETLKSGEIAALLGYCVGINTGDENCCTEWDAAIDALGATTLALEACRGGSAENASKAGNNALNPLYQTLVNERLGDTHVLAAGAIQALHNWIDSEPRMMAERQRQFRVLEFLGHHQKISDSVIQELRSGRF